MGQTPSPPSPTPPEPPNWAIHTSPRYHLRAPNLSKLEEGAGVGRRLSQGAGGPCGSGGGGGRRCENREVGGGGGEAVYWLRGGDGRRGERRKKQPWTFLCFKRTRSNPPPPDATRSACLPDCRPHSSQRDQSPRCDRHPTPRSTSSRHAPPHPTRCSSAAVSSPKVASLNLTRAPPPPLCVGGGGRGGRVRKGRGGGQVCRGREAPRWGSGVAVRDD